MFIDLTVRRRIAAAPAAVFALALDPERFPPLFSGCGPIPALRRIVPQAPPAIGSCRLLENSDGSRLSEQITAFEPPHRHAYRLEGLRPPLCWLARYAHAEWTFRATGAGTEVRWNYRWTLTGPLAWPLAAPLLMIFMRSAMRRCLAAMADHFELQAVEPA